LGSFAAMKKKWTTCLFGLAALACVIAAGVVATPRVVKRRAIASCREGKANLNDLWTLERIGDDESVRALAAEVERNHDPSDLVTTYRRTSLRKAVEIFAHSPEPRDPGVEETFRSWASSPDATLAFLGLYLLDELRSPRYPDETSARAHGGEVGGSATGSSPLTMTVAVLKSWGVTVENAERLERRVPEIDLRDSQEPRKAVRAWATLNGCTVREKTGNVLEIVPGQR
jgi:hypothetical protein